MASRSGFSILWLDAHIGEGKQYPNLRLKFQVDLAPAAVNFDTPMDPIDQMIGCVQEFAAPITFASKIPAMLELIEQRSHDQEKIIFITSGSLGGQIIPTIRERGWPIHSYYIFCFDTVGNSEWALELLDSGVDIQMFDFELDLLIRLARDLSNKIIEQGKAVLNDNPRAALSYFECARTLAETAVKRDTPSDPTDMHRPSTTHRRILDGEDGLIARAQRACGPQ
jgi:hypothetical protein